jgi:enoyl-CoA hydratase/carnithine racemase
MEFIRYKKEDALAFVQFNRPKSLNAFNESMLSEFLEVLKDVKNDPLIKVMIVSGEGRAFSAGVDLKSTDSDGFQAAGSFMKTGNAVAEMLVDLPKVTIAQVHGYCFTGALELMLMFDLAFCSDETQFGDTHAKWAVMPRWGMTQRLARRVGLEKAKELTFRAMRVSGPEAERIGLVNRSFAESQLEAEVVKIANEVSENSFEAIVAIKKLYNGGFNTTLKEGLQMELDADTRLASTDDQIAQFQTKKFNN